MRNASREKTGETMMTWVVTIHLQNESKQNRKRLTRAMIARGFSDRVWLYDDHAGPDHRHRMRRSYARLAGPGDRDVVTAVGLEAARAVGVDVDRAWTMWEPHAAGTPLEQHVVFALWPWLARRKCAVDENEDEDRDDDDLVEHEIEPEPDQHSRVTPTGVTLRLV